MPRAKDADLTPQPEPIDAEPAAATAAVRTVEAWAESKGLYPHFTGGTALQVQAQGAGGHAVAVPMSGLVGPVANPEFWRFAAAKALYGWPIGQEITEAQFDAAITAAASQSAR